jgi:hypothetical protein
MLVILIVTRIEDARYEKRKVHICIPLIISDCNLMMAAIEGRNM